MSLKLTEQQRKIKEKKVAFKNEFSQCSFNNRLKK